MLENVQQLRKWVSGCKTGRRRQTQWLRRKTSRRLSVARRPSRPPTRREGLRNAFYWIACLVAPPFLLRPVSDVPLHTLPGKQECVFVRVVSVFLFAWTWVFHVHSDHQCCGSFAFISILLTDYVRKDCTRGSSLFITVRAETIIWWTESCVVMYNFDNLLIEVV